MKVKATTEDAPDPQMQQHICRRYVSLFMSLYSTVIVAMYHAVAGC